MVRCSGQHVIRAQPIQPRSGVRELVISDDVKRAIKNVLSTAW